MTHRYAFTPLASAFAVALTLASASSIVDAQELNIYNWSDNIADDTVSGFVKQTGTHTRYDVYDSDETLQAKLLAPRATTSSYRRRLMPANRFRPACIRSSTRARSRTWRISIRC